MIGYEHPLPFRRRALRTSVPIALKPAPAPVIRTIEEIVAAAAYKFNITIEQLQSPSRKRDLSEVRMMVFKLAYQFSGKPFIKIGKYFNRDHSTVIYGCKTCDDLTDTNRSYKIRYDELHACIVNTTDLKLQA